MSDKLIEAAAEFLSRDTSTKMDENEIIHEASTRSYGRYTQILFSTGAKSWQDNHDKVTKIHKSVISAHPDKVSGKFGGDGSGGYISVNNKKHVDIVKDHIRKAGGIIND